MDSLTSWLASITWPLVSRVLAALGFGFVTYEGANTAVEAALSSATTAFAGMASEVAQLLARAGFFDALAITSGGIVSGLAWMVMKRWALQATGPA